VAVVPVGYAAREGGSGPQKEPFGVKVRCLE
jgi:hypothetical protein